MTYIELFDENAAENICACLVNPPERVVLVGYKNKELRVHAERYRKIFKEKGHDVDFDFKSISRNDLGSIVEALTKLVLQYDNCVIDLTGGEDLYLVAVGIIMERYKDRGVKTHRFNLDYGTVIDSDGDGVTVMAEDGTLKMSVEENIRFYGGDIVYDDKKAIGTHIWDMNEDFRHDIEAMWQVCRDDTRRWNSAISTLGYITEKGNDPDDHLFVRVNRQTYLEGVNKYGARLGGFDLTLKGLKKAGVLTEYSQDSNGVSVRYKNRQVKMALAKSGLALELYVYMSCLDARDENGEPVYNDALNGVLIDWDGSVHIDGYDTENEIDVMMMHGVVPVFISCKNGTIEKDELYKFCSVANRFGGSYSRKILIATSLDKEGRFEDVFRARAEDMGVWLIDDLQSMSKEEEKKLFRCLWHNKPAKGSDKKRK